MLAPGGSQTSWPMAQNPWTSHPHLSAVARTFLDHELTAADRAALQKTLLMSLGDMSSLAAVMATNYAFALLRHLEEELPGPSADLEDLLVKNARKGWGVNDLDPSVS